jgi:DNA polymerase III alpha subunit (gram-positive type)
MPFITIDGLGAQVAEDIVFKREVKNCLRVKKM